MGIRSRHAYWTSVEFTKTCSSDNIARWIQYPIWTLCSKSSFGSQYQTGLSTIIVGNPIGKKTLTFTFDGKIEYIILPVLILFLDMWQNTYGWMPSLWLLLSCRNRSKVNWVQNIIYFATDTDSLYFVNLIMTRVCQYYIKILDVHLWCHFEFTRLSMHDIYLGQRSFKYTK